MKTSRFIKVIALVATFMMLVTACTQPAAPQQKVEQSASVETVTEVPAQSITIGATYAETSAQGQALAEFKSIVEEETNGRITIDLKLSSVLGSEAEMLDQVKLGVIGGMLAGGFSGMNQSDARLSVEGLPFLFTSEEKARAAYNGEFGQKIFEIIDGLGYKCVCFFEGGFRQITNNVRPIYTPSDMEGIKIRVVGDVRIKAFESFGAAPTTMAIGEVYSALQQGALDAQENPYSSIISRSFYDVQKYLSISNHEYSANILMFNPSVWQGFSAEDQTIIAEAAKTAQALNYQINDEFNKTSLETCKNAGMEINEVDAVAFQEAAKAVWEEYEAVIGEELIALATAE